MSDPKGYYKVLNLEPGSDMSKVKAAYASLISKHHAGYGEYMQKAKKIEDPQKQEQAIEEIKKTAAKLNEAKLVLTDADKKAEYDSPQNAFSIFDVFNFNKVRKVKDTSYEITITMAQAYMGITKKFKIKRMVLCTNCEGRGGDEIEACDECKGQGKSQRYVRNGPSVRIYEQVCQKCRGECRVIKGKQCGECKGKKYVNVNESLEVTVNAGVMSGEEIQFEGMGDEREGHVTGNLIFNVVVDEGEYSRSGDHIIAPIKVDLYTALAGGTIFFKHLDDKVYNVSIKKIRSFNEMIRVKRLGFNGRGDLYLNPEYEVPNISTEKLKQIFKVPQIASGEKIIGEHAQAPENEMKHEEQGEAFNVFKNFFSF